LVERRGTEMFTPESEVHVTQLDAPQYKSKFWRLDGPLEYTGNTGETFKVEANFETDFASVPRMFVWFLPRYGRYTRAAILHDLLWDMAEEGKLSWHDADGVFRRAMRELKVPFLRRWFMWTAVRWAALAHISKGAAKGWWRDAPGVLLFTLLALPIVAPPAALILIALTLFYFYEVIIFAALWIGRTFQAMVGHEPVKELNPPGFSLKSS
jgi:hypothetical protein